jgi:predicted MPP superfamily phosphohydrolase
LRVAQGQPVHLILAVDNLHAQIRIPGVGVIRRDSKAPLSWERGWIREGTLSMYLSPGLGTRWLPFRFFLRPEVVCVELSSSPSS